MRYISSDTNIWLDFDAISRVDLPFAQISNLSYEAMRQTKHFTVEDTCIGCGLCERKCPAQAIQLQNKKPV